MSDTNIVVYILTNIANGLLSIIKEIINLICGSNESNNASPPPPPPPQQNYIRANITYVQERETAVLFPLRRRNPVIDQESVNLLQNQPQREEATSSTQTEPPPPPTQTTSTSTATNTTRKIPVYQRGDLHPSRWIYITDVEIPNCPSQVTSLYYERPDEGNRLLSVSGVPPNYHPSAVVQGSSGLSSEFLRRIGFGNWWCETKEEEFKYVPVYQRGGHHPSKWIFKENVPIKKEYKDIIQCLYYARSNEGNELLAVDGQPNFYHLYDNGGRVRGAERLPRDYLNKMSQFGWWRY